jgi:hypothetical protein
LGRLVAELIDGALWDQPAMREPRVKG